MKVLQVINSLGTGGAEKLLLETIPFYKTAGIEMDILVFWNNNHQFINALKALNCCKVIILKESPSVKSVYNPLNIFKLRKYLKQYDIDLESLVYLGYPVVREVNRFVIIPIFNFLRKYINNFGIIILLLTIFIKSVLP